MKFPLLPLRFGYDTYERHRLVSSLQHIDHKQNILDVGGKPGLLGQFLVNPVTVTNLSEGDVISSGLSLPFADSSFEIVTSLDVLEHIPSSSRSQFVAELLRVAGSQVLFCVPLGSLEHCHQEKKILESLLRKGITDPMLEEHISLGLPSQKEILAYIPGNLNYREFYSGDFHFNSFMFQVDHLLGNSRLLKPLGILLSVILNLVGNLIIYPLFLYSHPHKYTNRVTMMILKNNNDGLHRDRGI
jgi:hypothetical protein